MKLPKEILSIEGSTSESELEVLADLASKVVFDRNIVEIGSHKGRSLCALAYGANDTGNSVYSIDPHLSFVGAMGTFFCRLDMRDKYENICRSHVGELVFCVSLPSEKAWQCFSPSSVGLLFIDGDHNKAKEDFYLWKHTLVRGATVAFHDAHFGPVIEAIEDATSWGHLEEVGREGLLAWFRST